MSLPRLDHIGIIVSDLDRAVAFFEALGLEAGAPSRMSGAWADRVIGIAGMEVEMVAISVPGSDTWLEVSRFVAPETSEVAEDLPSDALGIRHVTLQVEDVAGTLEHARALGYETVGTVEDYEDVYRLCYLRGPDGIIVEVAERLGD